MVRAKNPAFRLFVDEFLNGTRHFTAKEVGIYILFLCEQWDQGVLPNDEKELCKIGRCSRDGMKNVLKKFKISEEFGGIFNEKLKKEKEESERFFEKNRINGRKGGRPKVIENQSELNGCEKPNGFVWDNPNETQTITQTEPTENPTSTSTSTSNNKEIEGEFNNSPTPATASNGGTELQAELLLTDPVPPVKTPKKKSQSKPPFVAPSSEEVKVYFQEYRGAIWEASKVEHEAEKWHAYYSGNGWKVGKNPMKDWKGAVRSWALRNEDHYGSNSPSHPAQPAPPPGRSHIDILNRYKQ